MIAATLAFTALSALSALSPAPTPAPAVLPAWLDDELDARLAAAGKDVAALWEVRVWLERHGREEEARGVLESILALDPEHADAHRALAHHRYAERWFETYTELSRFMRAEERSKLEEGLARWGDGWAPVDDLPYLKLGWERQANGEWTDPLLAARRAEDRRLAEAGWQQQDLTWIPPEEFDPWREGLFKCGDEWKTLEAADSYHAELGQWWRVPGEHFVAYTTLVRAEQGPEWAVWWADRTWDDLVRLFGVAPGPDDDKPVVVALNGIDQYNEFAAGNPQAGRNATEFDGYSSLHYAFYADGWFEDLGAGLEYMGSGVGWWDRADQSLASYGQHSIRHAAAHSYIEAIDPSWNAVSDMVQAGYQVTQTGDFWAEKRIPRWLRYGAASYVERYFIDTQVGEGGDPSWARSWALTNLKAGGRLGDLETLFEFPLDINDIEASTRLIHEAGAVVAFLLDGGDKQVAKAHAAFTEALKSGADTTEAVADLERALIKAEKKLRAFAN